MTKLLDVANNLVRRVGNEFIASSTREVYKLLLEYSDMGDDELKEECKLALRGELRAPTTGGSFLSGLLGAILGLRRHSPLAIKRVALGIEVFKRAPADLPPSSELYPQQIRAALALTKHALIQMDTGEGKTYALLPAAFALACRHNRVYIVCANEYLAERDALRTRPFWEFVGLTPGLCPTSDAPPAQWSQRVIYTTLSALIFKSLSDETAARPASAPLTMSAVVLDEADAILLDQTGTNYSITTPIRGDAFDWTFSINAAANLSEEDITVDSGKFTASLTVEGEERFKSLLAERRSGHGAYFLERHALEVSYVATRVAREEEDYVVDRNRVCPVDRVTGKIQHNVTPHWVLPLEFDKKMKPRPQAITMNTISPRVLLNSFKHLSGLSGTIADDSLEYLFSYLLPTLTIPPRFPREGKVETDLVYLNREDALNSLAAEVEQMTEQQRPILVGTQSIADAQDAFNVIQQMLPDAAGLVLLTGKNEEEAAQSFRNAGQVGSIVVATQLAGRGVDIRLTEQAQHNGGLALFSMGHAIEMRHDKQFLGRAGRQGDPYSARFICSLDDALMRVFSDPQRAMRLLSGVGMEKGEAIESPLLTKQIATAQRRVRQSHFRNRRNAQWLNEPELEIRERIRRWFSYLQVEREEPRDPHLLSSDFLEWTINHFVDNNIELSGARDLSTKEAEHIVSVCEAMLGCRRDAGPIRVRDLEGYPPDAAKTKICSRLLAILAEVEERHKQILDRADASVKALYTEIGKWNFAIGQLESAIRVYDDDSKVLWDTSQLAFELLDPYTELPADKPAQLPTPFDDVIEAPKREDASADLERLDEFAQQALEGSPEDVADLIDEAKTLWRGMPNKARDGGRERLERILETLHARVARVHDEAHSHGRTINLFSTRCPRAIAHTVLRTVWSTFLEEYERIRFQAAQRRLSSLDYFRTVSDRMMAGWFNIETTLSSRILRALLDAEHPERLDELFWLDDHRAEDGIGPPPRESYSLETTEVLLDAATESEERQEELIKGFVESVESKLDGAKFDVAKLRWLLRSFLKMAPLVTLQTPNRIYTALQNWFQEEYDRGVEKQRHKLHQKWLLEFLAALRDRNLVGPLPDFRTKLRFSVRKIYQSVTEPKSIMPILGILGLTGLMLVGWFYGDVAAAKTLRPFLTHVDNLVFGGLLARGNVAAGCLALPILIRMFASLRGQDWISVLASPIATGIQFGLALWVAGWGVVEFDFLRAVSFLSLFIVAFLVMGLAKSLISIIYTESGLDATAGWLCFTILFVLLPAWVQSGAPQTLTIASVLVLAMLNYSWKHFNAKELTLLSQRIVAGRDRAIDAERVETAISVRGTGGLIPHAFGIVVAWQTYELSSRMLGDERGLLLSIIPAVAYFGVYAAWTSAMLRRRCSFAAWKTQLNKSRQRFKDAHDDAEMAQFLENVKRLLGVREVLWMLLVTTGLFFLFHLQIVLGGQFPIFVLVLFAGFALGEMGEQFAREIYRFLISRVPFQSEELDLSKLPNTKEEQEKKRGLLRWLFQDKTALTLGVIVALIQIAIWAVNLFRGALSNLD